ncbi:MAG: hypothetical protein N3A01_04420 [Bacteroidales bacterium]|nr:hypothetical protein [Bacteroidales bacterium]
MVAFSDKFNAAVIASIGIFSIVTVLFLLSFITYFTSLSFIILCLFLVGIGFAMFATHNTNAVVSNVEKHNYCLASTTSSTMRVLEQMMSMGLMMIMFAIFLGNMLSLMENYHLLLSTIKNVLYYLHYYVQLENGCLKKGINNI